jgi:hypothetical protein
MDRTMATSIDNTNAIVAFVRDFVAANGRGCPVNAIQYVGNFSAKDIKVAKESGMLSSRLGAEGGFFVKGEEIAPKKAAKAASLKSRMAELLRSLDSAEADALVAEYDAECAKRSAQ